MSFQSLSVFFTWFDLNDVTRRFRNVTTFSLKIL